MLQAKHAAKTPDKIYLYATAFGAGCCCLQVTLQGRDLEEALKLYDALIPMASIMVNSISSHSYHKGISVQLKFGQLALTAASPAYRGFLADVDCRWNIISSMVDDRTEEERETRGRVGDSTCHV